MLRLDHLAVAATNLTDGVAAVEDALGLRLPEPVGRHPLMGTHNRLLSLGRDDYLEVIAIDPDAPDPGRPRWFNLDAFSGPPRVTSWICRTDDLDSCRAAAPDGIGTPVAFERGDFKWRMLVPDDGVLPFGGWFPALIAWDGPAHPAPRLPASGCTLDSLTLHHPDAAEIGAALSGTLSDPRVTLVPAETPRLEAILRTPRGLRALP